MANEIYNLLTYKQVPQKKLLEYDSEPIDIPDIEYTRPDQDVFSDLYIKRQSQQTSAVENNPIPEELIKIYNVENDASPKSEKSRSSIPLSKRLEEFNRYYDEVEKENPEAKKYREILTRLAHAESGFDYQIQNRAGAPAFGYFLFMQDGKKWNNILRFANTDINTFRNNPKLQIESAIKLAKDFESQMSKEDLIEAERKGYSRNALLAGAWMGGIGGLRNFLLKGINASDRHWSKEGVGSSVGEYVKKFNFKDGGVIKFLNPASHLMTRLDTLRIQETLPIIYQLRDSLKASNYPRHQIAGILGNVYLESRFNPDITNKTSGAYGLFQLTGSRKKAYLEYASKHPNVDKITNEIGYGMTELNGKSAWYKGNREDFVNTKNINDASDQFTILFERPAPKDRNLEKRRAYSNYIDLLLNTSNPIPDYLKPSKLPTLLDSLSLKKKFNFKDGGVIKFLNPASPLNPREVLNLYNADKINQFINSPEFELILDLNDARKHQHEEIYTNWRGLKAYGSNPGVSGTDPIGLFVVEGVALGKPITATGKFIAEKALIPLGRKIVPQFTSKVVNNHIAKELSKEMSRLMGDKSFVPIIPNTLPTTSNSYGTNTRIPVENFIKSIDKAPKSILGDMKRIAKGLKFGDILDVSDNEIYAKMSPYQRYEYDNFVSTIDKTIKVNIPKPPGLSEFDKFILKHSSNPRNYNLDESQITGRYSIGNDHSGDIKVTMKDEPFLNKLVDDYTKQEVIPRDENFINFLKSKGINSSDLDMIEYSHKSPLVTRQFTDLNKKGQYLALLDEPSLNENYTFKNLDELLSAAIHESSGHQYNHLSLKANNTILLMDFRTALYSRDPRILLMAKMIELAYFPKGLPKGLSSSESINIGELLSTNTELRFRLLKKFPELKNNINEDFSSISDKVIDETLEEMNTVYSKDILKNGVDHEYVRKCMKWLGAITGISLLSKNLEQIEKNKLGGTLRRTNTNIAKSYINTLRMNFNNDPYLEMLLSL